MTPLEGIDEFRAIVAPRDVRHLIEQKPRGFLDKAMYFLFDKLGKRYKLPTKEDDYKDEAAVTARRAGHYYFCRNEKGYGNENIVLVVQDLKNDITHLAIERRSSIGEQCDPTDNHLRIHVFEKKRGLDLAEKIITHHIRHMYSGFGGLAEGSEDTFEIAVELNYEFPPLIDISFSFRGRKEPGYSIDEAKAIEELLLGEIDRVVREDFKVPQQQKIASWLRIMREAQGLRRDLQSRLDEARAEISGIDDVTEINKQRIDFHYVL